MSRRRQSSGSKEIARFDRQNRGLFDPIGNVSVHLTEKRHEVLAGRERKTFHTAGKSSGFGNGVESRAHHAAIQDKHALTGLGKDID